MNIIKTRLKISSIILVILMMLTGCTNTKPTINEDVTQPIFSEEETDELETPPVESEEIPIIEDKELSLVMVGDMLMHMGVVKSGYMEDGTRNYDHLFAHMKPYFKEADLAIVNQETILGGKELGFSGYPTFNSPDELGDAIVNAGFNIVLHATNHAMDKGKTGLLNCIQFWEVSHPEIAMLGINDSKEDQDTIFVYEVNDMKIALLNYTYGTNGLPLPKDMPYAVNLLEEDFVVEQIKKAEEVADFTIVLPHWGTEYQLEASTYQEEWCELFVENGVDLVIGAHPHVIQPITWYKNDNGNKMLVYYSLGNFVNATNSYQSGVANRMVGAMADVTLKKDALTGIVSIKEYGVLPIINHYEYGLGKMSAYPISEYTDELVERSDAKKRDPNFSVDFCYDLATKVFGEELMNGPIICE